MARESFISRLGLFLGCLVGVIVIGFTVYLWTKRVPPAAHVDVGSNVGRSLPGWETRYTATAALARRGSDAVVECMEIFKEMLDEDQQKINFRTKLHDGREAPNEVEAFQTVTNGLKAISELHRKRPDIDLKSVHPAIKKLTESSNPAMRAEAVRTKLELGLE